MFPFGWAHEDGPQHREELYQNMVVAANCSYHRWANKRWDHSYLRRCAPTDACTWTPMVEETRPD